MMTDVIKVGQYGYYTVSQLAEKFGVPEHHFIDKVRRGELNGQKVGKAYVISAEQFHAWITGGNFSYRKRRRQSSESSVDEAVSNRICP